MQLEQTDETLKMLDLFIKLFIGKEIKPIESIAAIYVQWQLKDKALQTVFRQTCRRRKTKS